MWAGPNLHVDLPAHGFLRIGVHISKEWNNNGFSDCPSACFVHGGPVSFDPAVEFELVWLNPLAFTGLPKPDVYLAVEIWQNKFGNDHTKVSGSQQVVAPTIGVEYHF
ncbi:MAG TPA: hypothetical protein VGM32_00685 [Rhodopila sp.]